MEALRLVEGQLERPVVASPPVDGRWYANRWKDMIETLPSECNYLLLSEGGCGSRIMMDMGMGKFVDLYCGDM